MVGGRQVYREGQRFGKLTAISYVKSRKYLCKCDCGNEKIISTVSLIHGNTKSCGCISSINRDNYMEDMKKKLLRSIDITENGCWEWNKSRHKQGYGNFCFKFKILLAHRVSWMIYKGNLDDKIFVCHKCDNPPCVNPDHLWLGNHDENIKDAYYKNRMRKSKGEDHYYSKHTEEQILNIKNLLNNGMNYDEIFEKTGVKKYIIGRVARGKSWKHL